MEYKLNNDGDSCCLFLSGEIDLHYSPELRKVMLSVYKEDKSLSVDLSEVQYLDSSGVACFVEAYQLSKKMKLDFTLINVSEPVMQVIKLARLDTVFPIK